ATVFAQSSTHDAVRDILDRYGYNAERIETLSTAEVTEIYLTANSETSSDVRVLLSGLELEQNPAADATFERTADVDVAVASVLDNNGIPADAINFLTDADIAELYLASTAEDAAAVENVIASFDLPSDMSGDLGLAYNMGDNLTRVVSEMLIEMGYTQDQIDTLTQDEMAEIYLASTSEDATAVERAIDAALMSS
ncbi:MAG: hypothetical protein AAF376_18615, partial [Pseudomonadota bacterium]